MDARTEHLIALVKDGATLRDAARLYGIRGERVRQILREAGLRVSDLPGRGQRPSANRRELARDLAPVIEAMWRAGMLYHEIAKVFDSSCEAVHHLICDRVPEVERADRRGGSTTAARHTSASTMACSRRRASSRDPTSSSREPAVTPTR